MLRTWHPPLVFFFPSALIRRGGISGKSSVCKIQQQDDKSRTSSLQDDKRIQITWITQTFRYRFDVQLWVGATGTVAEVTCQQVVTAVMIWNWNLYSQATWHRVEWILNASSLLIASSFHSKQLHQRRAGSMPEPASIQGWPGFVFIEDMLTWWQNGFTSSQGFYSNHPKGWIPEWCMCRYNNPGILWCSHKFPRILGSLC